MHVTARRSLYATLLLLPLLLTGCASVSQPSPPVRPALIPPLPAEARQPVPPPICSPTCSAGLTTLRDKLLHLLTPPTAPAQPASGPTTR